MANPSLERDNYIDNKEHNPVAKAKEVVLKGFDGNSYPAIKTNENGEQVIDTAGFSKSADITITKTVNGNVTTFVKTDGVKTQTITIDKDTNITTKVWS